MAVRWSNLLMPGACISSPRPATSSNSLYVLTVRDRSNWPGALPHAGAHRQLVANMDASAFFGTLAVMVTSNPPLPQMPQLLSLLSKNNDRYFGKEKISNAR